MLEIDKLEAFVDAHGLESVISMLADICCEKAGRLRASRQDERTAQVWHSAATRLSRAHPFFEHLGI
jgi:hypothetical protein